MKDVGRASRWFRGPATRRERAASGAGARTALRVGLRTGAALDRVAIGFATCGGLGFLPKGSAVAAALGATLAALAVGGPWNPWVLGLVVAVSWFAVRRVQRACRVEDPGEICIDEVVGAWLAVLVSGASGAWCLAALALFGAFDFVKPWPANRLDSWHGGGGVLGDDLVAGLYAGLVTRGVTWGASWALTVATGSTGT